MSLEEPTTAEEDVQLTFENLLSPSRGDDNSFQSLEQLCSALTNNEFTRDIYLSACLFVCLFI